MGDDAPRYCFEDQSERRQKLRRPKDLWAVGLLESLSEMMDQHTE